MVLWVHRCRHRSGCLRHGMWTETGLVKQRRQLFQDVLASLYQFRPVTDQRMTAARERVVD